MSSLKDQLLKTGLTDKQSVRNLRNKKSATKPKSERGKLSSSAMAAQQAQRDKVRKDKELNRQKQLEVEQKAQLAQIKQLIEVSKIERNEADQAYSFNYQNQIKTIYVTAQQRQQLVNNQIAIVANLADSFELVPLLVANKIAQRGAGFVVAVKQASATKVKDDPYAEYQIPDDQMW